jgi:hypothetical protein
MLFCQMGAAYSLREICGGLGTALTKETLTRLKCLILRGAIRETQIILDSNGTGYFSLISSFHLSLSTGWTLGTFKSEKTCYSPLPIQSSPYVHLL